MQCSYPNDGNFEACGNRARVETCKLSEIEGSEFETEFFHLITGLFHQNVLPDIDQGIDSPSR